MSLPPSILAAAEGHHCFSGCFSHETPVALVVDPNKPPVTTFHAACQDCLMFHVGSLATLLPPGMTQYELVDTMMRWRFGDEDHWHVEKCLKYWDGRRELDPPKEYDRLVPKMCFEYLMNISSSGGYGFVGEDPSTPGNWIACSKPYKSTHVIGRGGARPKRYGGDEDECVYFRRTYWYRSGKGVYAPTLECGRRMVELGFVAPQPGGLEVRPTV